jgi:hypothetical protein
MAKISFVMNCPAASPRTSSFPSPPVKRGYRGEAIVHEIKD